MGIFMELLDSPIHFLEEVAVDTSLVPGRFLGSSVNVFINNRGGLGLPGVLRERGSAGFDPFGFFRGRIEGAGCIVQILRGSAAFDPFTFWIRPKLGDKFLSLGLHPNFSSLQFGFGFGHYGLFLRGGTGHGGGWRMGFLFDGTRFIDPRLGLPFRAAEEGPLLLRGLFHGFNFDVV